MTKKTLNVEAGAWQDRQTILIVSPDMMFGMDVAKDLCPDGHRVLGPVSDLSEAYRLIIDDRPSIAVLDTDLDLEDITRLSDMFLTMDVPHLLISRQAGTIKRLMMVNGEQAHTNLVVSRPLTAAISHAVWDIHSRSLVMNLLEDGEVSLAA